MRNTNDADLWALPSRHVRSGAVRAPHDSLPSPSRSLLYDLFTLPALVEARPEPPPLLLALNKADRPGARTVDTVQTILEAEL